MKSGPGTERQEALNFLAQGYWRPVYLYVRQRGQFRSFLLKSLQHFLANAQRDAHAKKRHPTQGFVAIHELLSESGPVVVPMDTRTPDEAFHRNWLRELVLRVLRALELECQALSQKDVENRVITARRAYQRLLREEIRLYASSDEEVATEIRDLWRFMAE